MTDLFGVELYCVLFNVPLSIISIIAGSLDLEKATLSEALLTDVTIWRENNINRGHFLLVYVASSQFLFAWELRWYNENFDLFFGINTPSSYAILQTSSHYACSITFNEGQCVRSFRFRIKSFSASFSGNDCPWSPENRGITLDVSAVQHSAFVSQTPSKVSDQVSRGIELTGGWMVLFLSVDS